MIALLLDNAYDKRLVNGSRPLTLFSVPQLTGVQALSDGGGFDQVAAAQVAGDEVVEVPHQVLPARRRHN